MIGSIRRECHDRVIPLGELHLRRIIYEHIARQFEYGHS
jgi:hypothetical protein